MAERVERFGLCHQPPFSLTFLQRTNNERHDFWYDCTGVLAAYFSYLATGVKTGRGSDTLGTLVGVGDSKNGRPGTGPVALRYSRCSQNRGLSGLHQVVCVYRTGVFDWLGWLGWVAGNLTFDVYHFFFFFFFSVRREG